MKPLAGPSLPAAPRSLLAVALLLGASACTSTDSLRLEAGDPLGADFVYVFVDSKKIETSFESDANEALLTPARIRDYPAYAQLEVADGKWRQIDLRQGAVRPELSFEDGGRAVVISLGFLFEDRPAYSVAIVTEEGGNWRAKVLGADDFLEEHELVFTLQNGYPTRKED